MQNGKYKVGFNSTSLNKTYFILFIVFILPGYLYSVPQYTLHRADSLLDALYEESSNDRDGNITLTQDLESYFESVGDTCRQIKALARLARYQNTSADFNGAIGSLIKSQKLYDLSTCETHLQVLILYAYAGVYRTINDDQKADSVVKLCIRMYDRDNPDKKTLIRLYFKAAEDYSSLENSLKYLDTAYRLALEYLQI